MFNRIELLTARNAVMLVAAVALAAAHSPAAHAQGALALAPWLGVYAPSTKSFSSLDNAVKLHNSWAGGVRLSLWGKSSVGLEITAGYSPANLSVAGDTINKSQSSNVFLGGAKLMLGSGPASAGFGLFVGAGLGMVRRGDNVLDSQTSQTKYGGLADVGFHLGLGSALGLRADVEDYIYHPSTFDGDTSWQHDFVVSAGLAISF